MNTSDLIKKIIWLTDKENGMGIPLTVLAKYCNCSSVSLYNYIYGRSMPTGRISSYIEEGLRKLKENFMTGMVFE